MTRTTRERVMDALAALSILALMAGLVTLSVAWHTNRPPEAWEQCGMTWHEMLSDPPARSACYESLGR